MKRKKKVVAAARQMAAATAALTGMSHPSTAAAKRDAVAVGSSAVMAGKDTPSNRMRKPPKIAMKKVKVAKAMTTTGKPKVATNARVRARMKGRAR